MRVVSRMPNRCANLASIGSLCRQNAVLVSLKGAQAVENLQANAAPTGRIDHEDGYFIELLTCQHTGEPMYRSCSLGGAICRYSSDMWQAELYVQHLRGRQG